MRTTRVVVGVAACLAAGLFATACGPVDRPDDASAAIAPRDTASTGGDSTLPGSVPTSDSAPSSSDQGGTAPGQTDATPPPDTGESATTSPGSTEPVSTEPVSTVPSPVNPLTGLEQTEALLASRPAIVVKIDGHFRARPQIGLERADIVVEEIVEGITRFMAIFHSDLPDVVGPVRSARTQDMLIVPMLNTPIFVWSGGNRKVSAIVKKGPVVNISASTASGRKVFYRAKKRRAPHNLLARGLQILAVTPAGAQQPQQLFSYRTPGDAAGGREISGVKVRMSGTRVQWLWSTAEQHWLRSSDGKVHRVDSGAQVSTDNVVILEVKYAKSKADPRSPEAQTTGSGAAMVLTGGRLIVGTWTRSTPDQPWVLLDENGSVITLTPGRTWVELALSKRTLVIELGVDPASVAWRAQ